MIFGKIGPVSKWQRRFLVVLFTTAFTVRGRINFTNLARFAPFCEQTFRHHFGKFFDWVRFNLAVLSLLRESREERQEQERCFLTGAIDCSFLPKSGKKTWGLGRFWSSTLGKARLGGIGAGFDRDSGRPELEH